MSSQPIVTVSIDTEEDNWADYKETGATTENIGRLWEVQDIFERWGARPTYLVNRPPLVSDTSLRTLAALAAMDTVEIGAHCHPWNTPPFSGKGAQSSMLHRLPEDVIRAMLADIRDLLGKTLGVQPTCFRSGRWGYGRAVSRALSAEGFRIDASVSPLMDWGKIGGPSYAEAPLQPYRFDPDRPLEPDPEGPMVELPTTIGYLRGDVRRSARWQRRLEGSVAARLKLLGLADSLGILARRWLSPEQASLQEMIRLALAEIRAGRSVLAFTFHSPALLPGATPFVRDAEDQKRFLGAVDGFLRFCAERGFRFMTLSELGGSVLEGGPEAGVSAASRHA